MDAVGEAASVKRQIGYRFMKSTHRGTNQIAVRSYNERLLLQLVRSQGELTKAEAIRVSMLPSNTTSVIFRKIEIDSLVISDNGFLGKRGQPSTSPLTKVRPSCVHSDSVSLSYMRTSLR